MSRYFQLIAILAMAASTPGTPAPAAEPSQETIGPITNPKGLPLELKIVNGSTAAYEANTRGDPALKFEERIREAEKVGELLPASVVEMQLEIKNTGNAPITIWIDGDNVSLTLDLRGPGAITATAKRVQAPTKAPTAVKIQPGKSHRIPLSQLEYGSRNERTHAYLTKAGLYNISATFRTGVSPAPSGVKKVLQNQFGEVILKSAPLEFRVVRPS